MATSSRFGPPIRLVEALQRFREDRGFPARVLSVRAGLSTSYVNKLESGEIAEPSIRSIARIMDALALNMQEVNFCMRCLIAEVRAARP